MFAKLLAKKYIFQQKRHSILTICSIITALALMTALFTVFSTMIQCLRDIAYDNQPWHYKITNLTKDKAESLLELPEFDCNFVIEKDYTCSVELLLKAYTEYDYLNDIDDYWKKLDIDKEKQLEVNGTLITYDLITLDARANMVQIFAVFYVFVIFLALALRLIIDTAFEVSSKERERQFGVLQSIGATPQQIVGIITYEGLFLSCIGIPLGILAGIGLGYAAFKAVLTSGVAEAFLHDGQEVFLHYHVSAPFLLIGAVTGLAWVLFSAYGTGMRVIKMTPVQAISNRSNKIKKVRKHSFFSLLFGWKGKLAARNNRRQPKRFLITVLSLTLSMVLFSSVSIIMEKGKIAIDRLIKDMYGDTPFDIMTNTKSGIGAESYLDTMKQIEDSGYFTNVCYGITLFGKNDSIGVFVNYVNENQYLLAFKNNPPVSYEDLKNAGGYLYASSQELTGDTLTLHEMFNYGSGEQRIKEVNLEYPVIQKTGIPPMEKSYFYGDADTLNKCIWLYAPLALYQESAKNLYDLSKYSDDFSLMLKDTRDHDKAVDFLHSLHTVETEYMTDIYLEHKKMDTMLSAIEIGLTCLNIMFVLIAVINMINIISTGIINRKSELASLQCIGMTKGQLYGVTVIECAQYALTAGVFSTVTTELLLFITSKFLKMFEVFDGDGSVLVSMDHIINYKEPIPNLLFAMAFAFVIAFLSSVIPLNILEKTPLTEQIRSVD